MPLKEISPVELKDWLDELTNQAIQLIDVREPHEHQVANIDGFRLLPMHTIHQHLEEIDSTPLVIMCHHGGRSMQVAQYLCQQFPEADIYNLTGGIDAWSLTVDDSIARY